MASRPPEKPGPTPPRAASRHRRRRPGTPNNTGNPAAPAERARDAGPTTATRPDMRSELPKLVSCRQIQEELGVTKATAEAVMRQLNKVRFPGSRRVYVRRRDVNRLIEQSTLR